MIDILYVAKDGNDNFDGKSSLSAFATLKEAYMRVKTDGAIIIIDNGVWNFDDDWNVIRKRNELIGRHIGVTIVGSRHSVLYTRNIIGEGMKNITMTNFTILAQPEVVYRE